MYRIDILKKMDRKQVLKLSIVMLIVISALVNSTNYAHAYIFGSTVLQIQELKYDPYPAEAGKYMDLWVKIENIGTEEAKDVTCVLLPEYPFSLDPNENATRNIGRLPGTKEVILQYKLRVDSNAVEGWNEMKIKCRTENSDSWTIHKFEIYVESKIPEFAIGSIVSDPTKLFPDSEENKLSVEIQNIGTGDAELVTSELILPKGITPSESYSNIANLGTIKEGESKTAEYYIDIDKKTVPGNYKAKLIIKYKDSNNNRKEYKNQTLDVNIVVKPLPLFEIENVSTNPDKLSQGDKASLRLTIKNVGFKEAKTVSVKIYKQSDQPFDFDEKYDYIGNLKPNQSGETVFRFDVNDNANLKTYFLKAEIRYLIGDEVKIVEKQIPIKVEMKKRDSKLFFLGILFVVFVILSGVYYGRKKIKK
ncbi:MAG: COG1361 S-layer family protein [Candidatus Aenigmarchaeota archaeon]|nr:COG1361 S-layer family protein [Candidatus Aenigmarchaeota archaeon]